jgi:hypothetical protein
MSSPAVEAETTSPAYPVYSAERLGDVEAGTERTRVTVPAGTYVVGDPCYTVPGDAWMAWLEASDYDIPGRYHVLAAYVTTTTLTKTGKERTRKHLCVGISTAYGDGCYEDAEGREYAVDAGLIGLVPAGVFTDRYPDVDLTNTVTFNGPVTCWYDAGVIHFEVATPEVSAGKGAAGTKVVIDTDPEDPEENHCNECANELRGGEFGTCDECIQRAEEEEAERDDEDED